MSAITWAQTTMSSMTQLWLNPSKYVEVKNQMLTHFQNNSNTRQTDRQTDNNSRQSDPHVSFLLRQAVQKHSTATHNTVFPEQLRNTLQVQVTKICTDYSEYFKYKSFTGCLNGKTIAFFLK